MKKSYLAAIVFLLIILGTSYWYWQNKKNNVVVIPETTTETTTPSVSTNPLDNKPDINPIDQTNPFKNIKTNPFE